MAVSVRPLLAIGLASAGIGVTVALAAAPQAMAAPKASADTANHQLVRHSAKASPGGGFSTASSTANAAQSQSKRSTAKHALTVAVNANSSSGQGSAPTSNKRVLSSDAGTPVAVKHHWGTHNGPHGLF
jgi:hypothetical protein